MSDFTGYRVRVTKTMQVDVFVEAANAQQAEDLAFDCIPEGAEWENSDLDWEVVSVEKA